LFSRLEFVNLTKLVLWQSGPSLLEQVKSTRFSALLSLSISEGNSSALGRATAFSAERMPKLRELKLQFPYLYDAHIPDLEAISPLLCQNIRFEIHAAYFSESPVVYLLRCGPFSQVSIRGEHVHRKRLPEPLKVHEDTLDDASFVHEGAKITHLIWERRAKNQEKV